MTHFKERPPAILLAGGKGTRLRSLYADRPKVLAPVAGKPFIEWQIEWLAQQGVRSIILASGYMADRLQEWLDQRRYDGIDLRLVIEPKPLGTGGAVRFAAQAVDGACFYVLNGDSFAPNADFQGLEQSFPNLGNTTDAPLAALAVAPIEDAGRYGTVEFTENGHITAFREKAQRHAGWINAGIYAVHRSLLESIPPDQSVSLENDTFPGLASKGRLRAVPVDGPLLDMGTPEGLAAMEGWLNTGFQNQVLTK